ncbi:hypothetical protein HOY80DRAFT_946494 [Tuber brumale]|nr:hypothetical protein HOY80DRAFT_946494 [Tuber brumale]
MDRMFPAGHLRRSDLKLCVDWKVATTLRANMEASNLKHVPQYQEPRSGNWINPSGEMLFNAMKAEDVRAMFLYILLLTRERGRKLSNGQLVGVSESMPGGNCSVIVGGGGTVVLGGRA